jgi:hypothetical protein
MVRFKVFDQICLFVNYSIFKHGYDNKSKAEQVVYAKMAQIILLESRSTVAISPGTFFILGSNILSLTMSEP